MGNRCECVETKVFKVAETPIVSTPAGYPVQINLTLHTQSVDLAKQAEYILYLSYTIKLYLA